ncbi:polyprenyl synthetase family protein [Porphyromonas sp.]|uniref:polyprenyl synthetase family protein n=1 Tax=Porphyromonas sp. TaxID=1924944 RepID=UPI0026DB9EF2|nr:polyprenyl synthetase family protein [Porphyromonas sp.]MDO4695473.1 polyprenyl synthetase family protein [Porphyromonas sp.]MDO4770293.1 polyprenyl synthetase family protein [Porphyromonas sp.]
MTQHQEYLFKQVEQALQSVVSEDCRPDGLYAPIKYGLSMGGKRLRPLLTLLAYRLFLPHGDLGMPLRAGVALEIFHNFTLLHDDLMDDAPVRRGQPTVYRKWDTNTAILSGDAMMIVAYRELAALPSELLKPVFEEFNAMALGVCEGQQYDMEFEHRSDVTVDEYMAMIHGKTSCLIASSMKIGAMIAGAPSEVCEQVYRAGDALGLAFQLMDDYLDIWGSESFGKRKGGDILEEKKTWLLIKALEAARFDGDARLSEALALKDDDAKIAAVTAYYEAKGLDKEILSLVSSFSEKAIDIIDNLEADVELKSDLARLVADLTTRQL